MAFHLLPFVTILMSLFSSSVADSLPFYDSPDIPCNSTPDPNFCKSILPNNKPGTVQDYAKISINQSFSNAKNYLSLIQSHHDKSSAYSESTVRALEDCLFLAELNVEFLSQSLDAMSSGRINGDANGIDELLTVISATLTNQETCSEGLQSIDSASDVLKDLSGSISNGSKFYSTSLALSSNGWVTKVNKGRTLLDLPFVANLTTRGTVVVNKDGSGNFTTINDAVNAATNNTNSTQGYFVIYVTAGVYEEYVSIPKNKKYVLMIGDGMDQTVITGNRSVADNWTTFNSATFAVVAQGFVAVNITFENTAGAIKYQAVAVRNGADLSAFYNCRFKGYQDTLYTHSLRQFYRDCEVYGTIDYIFGNAAVVLQNCKLYMRKPMANQYNVLTAQGRTDPNQNTGTSIHNCSILAAEDLGTTKSYLGRPWKDYSRTVVMQSFIDNLIDPAGWKEWSGNMSLSTLYYAEYGNTGPGSDTSNRVTWPGYHVIDATEAASFTVSSFIQGGSWLPATNVPFDAGLI